MSTRHVFVETNWVVDYVAPLISKSPGASELLERSRRGEFVLHVPAISLSEAQKVVRERMPRTDLLGNVRAFVRGKRECRDIDESTANAIFESLSQFQQHADRERVEAPKRIAALLRESALDVFHLDEEMLVRSTRLAAETGLKLESFDNAILAAILVRGATLCDAGNEVCFCTYDYHLQPWDRYGKPKEELRDLLDDAGVWVYGDFLLEAPPRPPDWPTR
jgi:predicted nucleic acid-binding protein